MLPLDGELQAITNPQLSWNAYPAGALGYELEISTAPDFSVPIGQDSSLTIPSAFLNQVTPSNFTTYYWGVLAIGQLGNRYSSLPVAVFTTAP